jgi:uracil-DNA glycosylase
MMAAIACANGPGLMDATSTIRRRSRWFRWGFAIRERQEEAIAPPRPECAPRRHARILELLPTDRLTLLVGSYAQQYYLPKDAGKTLVDLVRAFERFAPAMFPTPHPSWRSVGWQKTQPVVRGRTAPPAARRDKVPA